MAESNFGAVLTLIIGVLGYTVIWNTGDLDQYEVRSKEWRKHVFLKLLTSISYCIVVLIQLVSNMMEFWG